MTNKPTLSQEERRSKMIEMGVVKINISHGCLIKEKRTGFISFVSTKNILIEDDSLSFIKEAKTVPIYMPNYIILGHPLYKNNVEQWIWEKGYNYIVQFCGICGTYQRFNITGICPECYSDMNGKVGRIDEMLTYNWKDKDGKQNFNLHFQELPEENQQRIFDLLCKVFEGGKQ